MEGHAIIVDGGIVAWFYSREDAVEWACGNYSGKWIIVPHRISESMTLSEDEITMAEKQAKILANDFAQ